MVKKRLTLTLVWKQIFRKRSTYFCRFIITLDPILIKLRNFVEWELFRFLYMANRIKLSAVPDSAQPTFEESVIRAQRLKKFCTFLTWFSIFRLFLLLKKQGKRAFKEFSERITMFPNWALSGTSLSPFENPNILKIKTFRPCICVFK